MFSSLKKIILEQKEELVEILSETESKSVALQEIELSINALNGNNKYVEKKIWKYCIIFAYEFTIIFFNYIYNNTKIMFECKLL